MRTRRRRRIDLLLLAGAAVVVGVAGLAGAAVGDTERITRLWAGAQVDAGGAARIVEAIDYDFGSQRRHGILRTVPGLTPDDPVQVSSLTAPAQVEATGTAQETQLRIGDPGRTVSGRHRYTIAYPLDGVAPGGRLAWDAVGTRWSVEIAGAELHLVAPYLLEGARCVKGVAGSQDPCRVDQPEPGHLVATVGRLDVGQGATLYATAGRPLAAPALPAPPSGVPADPGTGLLPPALVALVAAASGAAPTSWLVRRAGRERVTPGGAAEAAFGADPPRGDQVRVDSADLASLATIEFVPPRALTPSQGGILLAESVREEHKVAWLFAAAVDGYLEFEGEGEGRRGAVTLVRLPHRAGAPSRTIDTAFDGRERLTLGRYDPGFAAAWGMIGAELAAWQAGSGLWDRAGDRRMLLARTLGTVGVVAGLVLAGIGGAGANRWGWGWLALVAAGALLAGAGVAAVVRAWELRVRTPAGSSLWLRTESFRRFLAASEARHVEEAARRGYLREYTAWAVALGEIDRWSRAVAASGQADPAGTRYTVLAPSVLTSTAPSAAAPSSASASSDGGGVGGGAGGGGGGSW